MRYFVRARASAGRFSRLAGFCFLGVSGSVSAYLATCPGGQEAVFYVQSVGDVGWNAGGWRDCVLQRVGTVALGKLTQAEIEGAIRTCDGTYPNTWDSWPGQRHVKFCGCAEHGHPGLRCRAKQWRSDVQEPVCPNPSNPYTNPISVASGCRTCARTLMLSGGGTVDTHDTLHGQRALVTYCSAQPEPNVLLQFNVTPLDPSLGPAGELRPAGSNSAGTSTFTGLTNANGEVLVDFFAPNTAGTHSLTASCTDPVKACAPNPAGPKTITVSPCDLSITLSGGGEVKPTKDLSGLKAEVLDCHGQPEEGVSLEITDTVEANSGFHHHGPDDDQRRLGQFQSGGDDNCTAGSAPGRTACTTDADGQIDLFYLAPEVAGTHRITAQCTNPTCTGSAGPQNIDVLIKDLVAIETPPASEAEYLYIGEPTNPAQSDTHPYRHYVTQESLDILEEIAWAYAERIEEPLCVNDASLPWGGVFDLGSTYGGQTWSAPHKTHSCGTSVDIAGNINGTDHTNPPWGYTCDVRGTTVSGRDRMYEFTDILRLLRDGAGKPVRYAAGETTHYHLYLQEGWQLPCEF